MLVSDLTKTYLGENILVKSAASLPEAGKNQITFCNPGRESTIKSVNAAIVVATGAGLPENNTYIINQNPRLEFVRILRHLYPVFVKPRIALGKNVQIHPSSIIGGEGFGYIKDEDGRWEKFLSIGGVRIEDDVDIGALNTIDRGTLSDTIIGRGTKIDNLVHIAHNVKVGKHCLIIAHAMIGGSVIVGNHTIICPGAQIIDQVKIGHNVIIGMGSVIIRDVPDNVVVVGVPGRILRKNT